jgi:hypothetical protein
MSLQSKMDVSGLLPATDSILSTSADAEKPEKVATPLVTQDIKNKKRKAGPGSEVEVAKKKKRVAFETIESDLPNIKGTVPIKLAGTTTPSSTVSDSVQDANAEAIPVKGSCLTCRSRNRKCTGPWPKCRMCKRDGRICRWGDGKPQDKAGEDFDLRSTKPGPDPPTHPDLFASIEQVKEAKGKEAAAGAAPAGQKSIAAYKISNTPTATEIYTADPPIPPSTSILSTIILTTAPAPAPSNPSITLQGEHILLARIPGSKPLQHRTIKKASAWFEKLLTDGNGVDLIEIGQLLGVRIYREEELDEYNRLWKEVAAQEARKKAQELADALEKAGGKGEEVAAGQGEELAVTATTERHDSDPVTEALASATKEVQKAATSPDQPNTDVTSRGYTLKLKLKPGFHGNAYYHRDGRARTERNAAILAEKDAAGSPDVVRVYDS